MNITNRILVAVVVFMGVYLHASELTPELQKHLIPDLANVVEQYVYDGTITLNPKYSIEKLRWSDFGLSSNQFYQLNSIFDHQYKAQAARVLELFKLDRGPATIVTQYLDISYDDERVREQSDFAAITLSIPENHIAKDVLLPIIPQMYLKGKKPGDRIMVTDVNGKQYDFKLAEDRQANMKEIAGWKRLGQTLIKQGFIGTHAQMKRFMANAKYFSCNRERILNLQKKDPEVLTYSDKRDLKCWNKNIDFVVHGKF